ncbi:MAG TPA: folylpolyglutamate synthase/dihydrofolate synthase family protein [Bacillota bacterium]|nr:folylpolyglutamate synthase/dihydrofolate synthase family protein [Bacillota bacterium]
MSQFVEAVTWIESLKKFGIKPGLERMEWSLEKWGHPERRLKFVHIAGTNGKGSTLNYISNVLGKAGYTVGTYISPAMGEITNRIQYNGMDIPEQDFAELVQEVRKQSEELENTSLGALTEFEVTTIVAILYFAKVAYPDIVVWETGLGGRLDCTNVILPLVSVITNISYDHMHILGNTLEQIAAEKAGIIKNGVPVALAVESREALKVICDLAEKKRATVYQLHEEFDYERLVTIGKDQQGNEGYEAFHFRSVFGAYQNLLTPLVGEHQVKNASLAVMVLEILRQFYAIHFEKEDLVEGLKTVKWPGRFEIAQKAPHLILDGAHNIEGVESFIQTFRERFPGRLVKLLFSALADKDVSGMVKRLAEICDEVIVTEIGHERATNPKDMEMWFRDYLSQDQVFSIPNWQAALEKWLSNRSTNDILVATGSLYFISDIRKVLGKAQASCSDLQGRADD